MDRKISTTELKNSVGEVVSAVRLRGDCYLVEQRGNEGAALVPVAIWRNFKRQRRRSAEVMEAVAQANALSEEEAMKLARREVTASRKARSRDRGE